MGVFRRPFDGQGNQVQAGRVTDPRLQPTPDYGTLGPGSDIGNDGPIQYGDHRKRGHFALLFFAAMGMMVAFLIVNNPKTPWSEANEAFSPAKPTSAKDTRQLDRMKPQKQAEALLELAVARNDGAVEQISSRIGRWQGKVKWDSQIATLTTAALNSNDMRVRESGIEVELAAYGLAKNSASFDYVSRSSESGDHAQKIWGLWALGLMANRGVESAHAVQMLAAHLTDSDEDSRRWAVEGLALAGTDEAIGPLLNTMHDDASATVRERAACSLAASGMFSHEQRMTTVPTLLMFADDPALDEQTHRWAFAALADITHQRLPNDVSAWRAWYDSTK